MKTFAALLIWIASTITATPVRAADGCTVLLCLAGHWQSIPECGPPVHSALRDLARGRGLPPCSLVSVGKGADARVESSSAHNCPPQYRERQRETASGRVAPHCAFDGVIHTTVDGVAWSDVWWSSDGRSVTNYSAAARAQLGPGGYDTQFDDDRAAWSAERSVHRPQSTTELP
jgi:hypothetical protein